jgi:L-alanine-DL-glutamate epimerase-like enolase superfamily enzyme
MVRTNDQSALRKTLEAAIVRRVSKAVDPPLISGIHHIDRIEMNVVELSLGGETGVGYTYAFAAREADSVTPLILHLCEALAEPGSDPLATKSAPLWDRINFIGRGGPPVMALSAIDMALWDLHARLEGVPLHAALGLPGAEQRVYAAGGSRSLTTEGLVEEALGFRAAGYTGYKMRIGAEDWRGDVARVAAVREAVGPEVELMVDANQAWSVETAIQAAEAMGPLELSWFEEPVDAEDFAAMAAVRAAAPMPIAAGETGYGAGPFETLVAGGCVDVLQPDLMRCGGITGFLEVAALGRREGIEVAAHLFDQITPQLPPTEGEGRIEMLPGWFDGLFTGFPLPEGGRVRPGTAPGTGIAFSAEALAENVVGVHEL